MKKLLIAALLGFASTASIAADVPESYVSVTVGEGRYKLDGDHKSNTGFGVAFGQTVSEIAGYELGYANLGRVHFVDGTGHSFYLAGVGRYPINEAFSIYGKIGPTVNYLSGDDSETRVRLLLGAGLSYQFDKYWAATLEYAHFGKSVGVTPTLWSVGARYSFQ